MGKILVDVGSVTTGSRLVKKLEKSGAYDARLISTPKELSDSGCSYMVKTDIANRNLVEAVIKKYNIRLRRMYIEEIFEGERIYSAVL